MRLGPYRRNLVVWNQSVGPVGQHGAPRFTRVAHTRRFRRGIRTGALLTVIGLIRLARAARTCWRPLLAGGVLTVVGLMQRSGAGSVAFLLGVLFLVFALLSPPGSNAVSERRSELERELAGYSTPAQRRDLEATLDLYPDEITYELRDILASQAMAVCNPGIPGAGRRPS